MANVTVESIKYHTTAGTEYPAGTTYTVDESAVDNLVIQGMARRVEANPARPAAPARTARRSGTAVEPMTTASVGITPKPSTRPARAGKTPLVRPAGRAAKKK